MAGFIFGRNKPAVGNGASETVVGARLSPGMLGPARNQRTGVLWWHDGAWLCFSQAMTSPVVLEERAEDGKKIHKGSGEKIAMYAALPVPHPLQQAPCKPLCYLGGLHSVFKSRSSQDLAGGHGHAGGGRQVRSFL